jgi:serine protease inhibitor ecotin
MAFTMACPNFKKDLKMVTGPLGINGLILGLTFPLPLYILHVLKMFSFTVKFLLF